MGASDDVMTFAVAALVLLPSSSSSKLVGGGMVDTRDGLLVSPAR